MARKVKLDRLFEACDSKGSGFIGPEEFRDLCAGFGIADKEAQSLFPDLDRDGDGRISFTDFAIGFKEYLGPAAVSSRRNSFVMTIEEEANGGKEHPQPIFFLAPSPRPSPRPSPHPSPAPSPYSPPNHTDEEYKSNSLRPLKELIDGFGHDDRHLHQLLRTSWEQLCDLHQQLQLGSNTTPSIIARFEGAFEALLADLINLYRENKSLEESFRREREAHATHLRALEEDLEAQVSKAEARAREESRQELDLQRQTLQTKMESELLELQNQLHLFQKVDKWMQQERQEGRREENKRRLDDAMQETRQLRLSLAETQTSVALLRSELSQMRTQYEEKCRELHQERENSLEYKIQNDNIHRQLQLLHEANKRLQDTNDSLLETTEIRSNSPRPYSHSHINLDRDGGSDSLSQRCKNLRSSSETGCESQNCSPSARDRNGSFRIKRLMDDLDSGHSTLRDPLELESNVSLQEEIVDSEMDRRKSTVDGSPKTGPSPAPSYSQEVISDDALLWQCTGPAERTYKVVFAGDASVGKSCFIHRLCKGAFNSSLASTLGVDFQVKTLLIEGHNVAVQLWDTAGQERFRSITKTYFRRADGVLLLYDVTNENSFLNIRQWVQDIEASTEKPLPLVLCANKVDLAKKTGGWTVPWEDGEKLARQQGATFLQTSSKTGTNVLQALVSLTREMMKHEDVEMQTSILKIDTEHVDRKNTGGCCSSGRK